MHRARVVALLCATLFPLVSKSTLAQPYIYVANTGEDTVSMIDVTTNTVVATYRTWFGPAGPNVFAPRTTNSSAPGPAPSRIVVDSSGNVFVLDRFFGPSSTSFSPCPLDPPLKRCHLPVLLKILPSGGTPSSNTSAGYQQLPILDGNNDNHLDIGLGEAADVRIAWAKEIGTATLQGTSGQVIPGEEGALGRALCLDLAGNLWVGLYWTGNYYKVSSVTGQTLAGPIHTPGHTPYGCVVDSNGTLWSASASTTVAEIDTKTNTFKQVWNHSALGGSNYAISLLGGCGSSSKVYLSVWTANLTYIAFDPVTSMFSTKPSSSSVPSWQSFAIAVTRDGNIVSGNNLGGVVKYTPSGNVLWSQPSQIGSGNGEVHGIIEDPKGDIWTVNRWNNSVSKYGGSNGALLGNVPVGLLPYTYANVGPPNCACALIDKSSIQCGENGAAGSYSYSFTFTNNSPFSEPATGVDMSSTDVHNLTPPSPPTITFPPVPSGGTGTVAGTFTVTNPQPGKRVCLDVKLKGGAEATEWCCPSQKVCFDLPQCPDCASARPRFICNQNGMWSLALTITNGGPSQATSVQVFSTTPGITVTPATTSLSLASNAQATVQLGISGATPGQTIDLTVSLHGPINPDTGVFSWCCSSSLQVVYPKRPCRIIRGEVFHDTNRNGRLDYGEEGLSGWTVLLEGGGGEPRTATTDQAGAYQFDDVQPGAYRLTVRSPGGPWRATAPESGSYAVTVDDRPTAGPYNFGFVRP
jgi:YVTN family beta-propeller protein